MTKALWSSITALADVWRTSSLVSRYGPVLTEVTASPMGRAVNQAVVMWAHNAEAQPLLLAPRLQSLSTYSQMQAIEGADQWFKDGQHLSQMFLFLVEWQRSRLPGYPFLAAPQLIRYSPWVVPEFNDGVPWLTSLRKKRLQFASNLDGMADALGVDIRNHRHAVQAVAADIIATPVSRNLESAWRSLNGDDLQLLAQSRRGLGQALDPERVAEAAGAVIAKQAAYCETTLDAAIRKLAGASGQFATALIQADRLLQQAAALFSQLIIYGPPRTLGPVVRVERQGSATQWAEVIVDDDPFPPIRLREIVRFATPALRVPMAVDGLHIKIGHSPEPGRTVIDGTLLLE